jgi:hypothetical protein
MNPRTQRQILIRESAEQIPLFTQTGRGGKMMAIKPRKMSEVHIVLFCLSGRADGMSFLVEKVVDRMAGDK